MLASFIVVIVARQQSPTPPSSFRHLKGTHQQPEQMAAPVNRRMRYGDDMDGMFDRLKDLTDQQRITIKERYRFLMTEYRRRLMMYALLFYILRITMTVGSLTVPALLSLSVSPEDQGLLKWLTWAISLAVTTANGLITLFKVDKRFFMLHSTAERLRTEAWQFLSLGGRYSGHYGSHRPTHANQYVYFTSQLERIRMKHIEEEFIRQADISDPNKNPQEANATSTTSTSTSQPSVSSIDSTPASTQAKRPPNTNVDVPSPADQDTFKTPLPRRRESESTVGSGDDHIVHVPPSTEMPVPGRGSTLSSAIQAGESLLLQTSNLRDIATESGGAPIQPRSVQQESTSPGDA
jgi:hypothetical protein